MAGYIAKRIILAVFTVWVISMLSWVVIQLPEGDAVDEYLDFLMQTQYKTYDPDAAASMRAYLSLDDPVYVQYGRRLWKMAQGDLGRSFPSGGYNAEQIVSVKQVIGDRLSMTVVLTGFTILVTWTFAIPVGIYSAVRQHSIGDYAFTFLGFTGIAVPDFLLGLVLMYVAFAYFDQSVGGLLSIEYKNEPWDLAKTWDLLIHLWIPTIVLGTSGTASLIRIMRNNLLDELSKSYVATARAKGVAPLRLIVKYPVRVAINPLVSTVGYLLPSLISGSIIVSVVLSLPTLGPILLAGILGQDPYLTGFLILLLGVLAVIGTLLSDILLAVVDPRIKLVN